MQISDIITDYNDLTKTTIGATNAPTVLVKFNNAYDRVASLMLKADSRWQWDDANNTDLPSATTTITSGTQDYSLNVQVDDAQDSAMLTIDRVDLKDANGNWRELDPILQQELKRGAEIALENYLPTNGTPIKYRAVGNSVLLYPIPNYTLAAAMRIYFTRGPNYFALTDLSANSYAGGTKIPGFNALFHQLISLWAAYDYALINLPALAPGYLTKIQLLEASINDFYGQRFHDSRARFSTSTTYTSGNQSGVLSGGGGDSNK